MPCRVVLVVVVVVLGTGGLDNNYRTRLIPMVGAADYFKYDACGEDNVQAFAKFQVMRDA